MTELSYETPVLGEEFSKAAPKADTAFERIKAWANGNIDSSNLKAESVEGVAIKAKTVDESKLSEAVKSLLGKTVSGLTIAFRSSSLTAANGELVQAGATMTVTAPLSVQNAVFGVLANGHEVTVKVTTEIKGDFVPSGAKEVTLVGQQHVVFECDGAAWYITAGEPKREQVYAKIQFFTKVESEAGIEPSATRPSFIVISTGGGTFEIGGVAVESSSAGNVTTYIVPAGQKWKCAAATAVSTLLL